MIVLIAAAVAGRISAVPGLPAVIEDRPTVPISREPAEETKTEVIG